MHEMFDGMEKHGAGGRGMTRREIMARVRAQALLVKQLAGQMEELSPDGIRCLRIGGAPGGGNAAARGLDVRLERRDAMQRMLERESARLRAYEAAARREMESMKPAEYAFCLMYYIEARSIKETSAAIERSVRQCERYRSVIGG